MGNIKSTASIAAKNLHGLVCVFAGATAGIGFATSRKMIETTYSSKFYVLRRNPTCKEHKLSEREKLDSTNSIVFIEAQVALIWEVEWRVIK
jgi:NADP-dependent 3-hydroxy acid dehydrogenase YdfG